MKFPLSWLKESIAIDLPPIEIAKLLTSAGLEVDAVTSDEEKYSPSTSSDTIFEISLTPNLGHCNSILGIARELSALTEKPIKVAFTLLKEQNEKTEKHIHVEVKAPKQCPRYSCRLIQNVKIAPSPEWMQTRLTQSGVRPINNVVDVTNYVMLECGQPMHAFDYDRVQGQKIIVRMAEKGEKFTTLDGQEQILSEEDLLICDGERPVALAGIMGGQNSEVTDATQHVLLEAAYFQPTAIRRSSKHLGLQTESSKRFERSVDPALADKALDRAAALLQELAHGSVCAGILDVRSIVLDRINVSCRLTRINELLGRQFSVSEVENILRRLDFHVEWDGKNTFQLKVPTYRADISHEIDIVEEVARLYGYDHITCTSPLYHSSDLSDAPIFTFETETRARLLAEGLQEFLTCDLIGPALLNIAPEAAMPEESTVKVLNPTSIEQSILRTSLLPGLLQVVKYNFSHQNHDLAGFEIGRIHFKEKEGYKEQSVAGIILTGKSRPHHWKQKPEVFDFFDLKGIVENFMELMGFPNTVFKANHLHSLHPGRQLAIYVGELEVGSFGEIHPAIVKRLDVPQRIYFAEINLHDLYKVRAPASKVQELAQYPSSSRDWTITLNEKTSVEKLLERARHLDTPLLEELTLVDIYESDALGKGKRNATFRFIYRDKAKTISQGAVDTEHARLVEELTTAFNR